MMTTTTTTTFLSLLQGLHSFRYQIASADGTTSDGIVYPLAVGGYRSAADATEDGYHPVSFGHVLYVGHVKEMV
jgi:hypothetical protein